MNILQAGLPKAEITGFGLYYKLFIKRVAKNS